MKIAESRMALILALITGIFTLAAGGMSFFEEDCCTDIDCTDCLAGFCYHPCMCDEPSTQLKMENGYSGRKYINLSDIVCFQSFISGIDHPPESIS